MKKLILFVFALMLTISINAQKKNFAGSLKHAGLTKVETKKALEINDEKVKVIKAIKQEELPKEMEKEKIKAAKKASSAKIKTLIGKEKYKAINNYWKKN
jgi:hypothetical protein